MVHLPMKPDESSTCIATNSHALGSKGLPARWIDANPYPSAIAPTNLTAMGRDAQCVTKNETMLSLLSVDSETNFDGSRRADQHEIMETELYKKFEEAFNITLRNNPGILPGVPTLIKTIQIACFEVQKKKAEREYIMRRNLEKAKIEKDQLEAQLRKEMGEIARRRNDLALELEMTTGGTDIERDALRKQIDALEAEKREVTCKTIYAAEQAEEFTKQLGYLSKSREELERALELELELVEKDRDALQKVLAEREKLQKQKMENKDLENKIEHVAQVASKEKKALQAEVGELKKFEDHIKQLRTENEEAQEDLELERKHIRESTESLRTKKILLMESWKDMEKQFQEEIDELQGKIQHAKVVHEEEMENIIKSRVMTYLKGVNDRGDETKSVLVGGDETVKNMGLMGSGSAVESPLDIDSIVREHVQAELKKKMSTERTELVEEIRRLRKEMKMSQHMNGMTKRYVNLGRAAPFSYEPRDIDIRSSPPWQPHPSHGSFITPRDGRRFSSQRAEDRDGKISRSSPYRAEDREGKIRRSSPYYSCGDVARRISGNYYS
jgi:hypothetical protein